MMKFEDDTMTWQRLDYSIMQNSPIALYWNVEIWLKHTDWFGQNGYKIISFDAADWRTEESFHEDLKAGLEFPDYYGMNLDALDECLGDLEFHDFDGIVIAIKNYHMFEKLLQRTAQVLLDVLADSSWTHLLLGKRLVALIQTDQADASFAPVGAKSVMWNPEEWLDSKRGL